MSDTGGQAPQKTAPGWYRDPQAVNTLRFWDGERWTANVQPMPHKPTQFWSWEAIVGIFLVAPAVVVCLIVVAAEIGSRR